MVNASLLSIPVEASRSNENIVTVVSDAGGHMGWLERYEGDCGTAVQQHGGDHNGATAGAGSEAAGTTASPMASVGDADPGGGTTPKANGADPAKTTASSAKAHQTAESQWYLRVYFDYIEAVAAIKRVSFSAGPAGESHQSSPGDAAGAQQGKTLQRSEFSDGTALDPSNVALKVDPNAGVTTNDDNDFDDMIGSAVSCH